MCCRLTETPQHNLCTIMQGDFISRGSVCPGRVVKVYGTGGDCMQLLLCRPVAEFLWFLDLRTHLW